MINVIAPKDQMTNKSKTAGFKATGECYTQLEEIIERLFLSDLLGGVLRYLRTNATITLAPWVPGACLTDLKLDPRPKGSLGKNL